MALLALIRVDQQDDFIMTHKHSFRIVEPDFSGSCCSKSCPARQVPVQQGKALYYSPLQKPKAWTDLRGSFVARSACAINQPSWAWGSSLALLDDGLGIKAPAIFSLRR
jgi:hypothetical protein